MQLMHSFVCKSLGTLPNAFEAAVVIDVEWQGSSQEDSSSFSLLGLGGIIASLISDKISCLILPVLLTTLSLIMTH